MSTEMRKEISQEITNSTVEFGAVAVEAQVQPTQEVTEVDIKSSEMSEDEQTQNAQYQAGKAAYREELRLAAIENAKVDRSYTKLHPSILSLEYPIPSDYKNHFKQSETTRGILEHYTDIILSTTECRSQDGETRAIWAEYKMYEQWVTAQRKALFKISDPLYGYEDPRYWLYGSSDDVITPPEHEKEEVIEQTIAITRVVLKEIVAAFPQLRESSLKQIHSYQVECKIARRDEAEIEAARAYAHRRRARARRARRAEREQEEEGYYMIAQRNLRAQVAYREGRGPDPAVAMERTNRARRPRRRFFVVMMDSEESRGTLPDSRFMDRAIRSGGSYRALYS